MDESTRELGAGARFLAWIAGLDQLLLGLVMLFLPWRFTSARYDALAPHLAVYGTLLTLCGLAVLVSQILPLQRARMPWASRLLSAATFALLAIAFARTQSWSSVLTYGLLGAGLLTTAVDRGGRLESRLSADVFMLVAAAERVGYGILLLREPREFTSASNIFLRSQLPAWGAITLLCGGLLILWQLRRGRRSRVVLSLLAAAPMLLWTYQFGLRGDLLSAVITTGLLATGVLVRPLLPPSWLAAPRRRLVNEMIAVSVMSVGAALIVLVAILLRQTEVAYQQRAQLDLATTADLVAHDSVAFLDTRVQQATLLSRDPQIVSFDPALQFPFVYRVIQGDPLVSQVSISNRDGITVVRSTGEQPNIDRRSQLPGEAEIFRTHQPVWDVTISPTLQVPVLVVRVPIFAPDGSFEGVYANLVRLSTLTKEVGELPFSKTGRIIIVDNQGRVIVHPDPDFVATQADLSKLPPVETALKGWPQPIVYRDGDQRWLSVQAPVPELGWTVLVERTQAEVLTPANRAREEALAVLVVMLLLATVAAVSLARGFSRPLVKLARVAEGIGEGSSETQLPEAAENEIGDLVRALRSMQERLIARTREQARAEEERAQLLLQEQAARNEAETLAEIGRRVSASLDLEQVLRTTAESARRLVAADATYIALTQGRRHLKVAAAVGNRTPLLEGWLIPAESGLSEQVLESAQPVQAHWDEEQAERTTHPSIYSAMVEEGIVSTLAVPILHGSEVVGVFWVHSRSHRDFARSEIALLGRLAAQAGVAIENARAHFEEQEARAEVEALLSATESLGVQAEPEAVLRTLIEQATLLLHAERAVYAVQRGDRQIVPGHWVSGTWIDDEHELRPRSISRRVWDSGLPYRSNDVENDPNSSRESVEQYKLRSQLTVPLPGPNGERLGLISLFNSHRPEGFSERDERLLVAICETGAAILLRANETATRLEAEQAATRRKQEVEALLAAADQLNSAVEPEEVLRRVVGIAADLLAVMRAGIATNEGDHVVVRHTLTDGVWRSQQFRLPLDDSIAGWVVQHGRPFRTSDLPRGPLAFHPASPRGIPETALSVPVLGRDGHVLGALQLFERRDGQEFTDDDQRLAEGIAHHAAVALERAAVALERATLVEELRRREDHLRHQAVTDPLTGLPNRSLFLDRLGHALAVGRRRSQGVAVLFLDLDGFKVVNDSLGHPTGDALLQAVGERLVASQRASDTVARFGGDEFAVLLEDVTEPAAASDVADRILLALKRPFSAGGHRGMVINASIGISFRGAISEPCSAEDLIREADIALYHAKAGGKGRAAIFATTMGVQAMERLELQTDLQRAIGRGELHLQYQPLVKLDSGVTLGAEALVRWYHPTRGLLGPDKFIPLAEETGLILPIGRWVLEEACKQAAFWQPSDRGAEPFRVSVNLSARQFDQPDLVEQVASALRRSRLAPAALMLEITETAVIQHPDSAIATLAALKRLGVRVAIDDFGTGYSSLSYLERLNVDMLKIDRSFMQGLERSSTTEAIVHATIVMAHVLGMEVTAEGIETADQLAVLSALACDFGQGYYLSRPRPASEIQPEARRLLV